jgi:fructokinase
MPTIFTIGETIYDIIFEHNQPVAARPGGSMLNTAVSLGRCGLKVEMITELGADTVGKIVLDFLGENGVSTSFIQPSVGFKTPVSLAFLDDKGNADYTFHINYPQSRLNSPWPLPEKGDVVLFGAFYSLDPAIQQKITGFVDKAKQGGAFIMYDPNIRKNHLEKTRKLMHVVRQNIKLADLVRGSDEDFENLFGLNEGEKVFKQLQDMGCNHLIYTRNREGAEFYSGRFNFRLPAKQIKVVSTIGAGDAFNAGIIFGLVSKGLAGSDINHFSSENWTELIGFGVTFAADVCGSYDNYISPEFLGNIDGTN